MQAWSAGAAAAGSIFCQDEVAEHQGVQAGRIEALHGLARKSAPKVLNNIGYIAMLRGDLADAEGYLTRSMEASPSFNEAAWENMRQLAELKKQRM